MRWAAIALTTERLRIGTLVTPVPRRRPVKLARETVTLDHLSNGRLIFGVGIGLGPWEWAADVREMLAYIGTHRTSGEPFDVVIAGESLGPDDLAAVEPYIQAGATWWLDDVSPWAFG